MKTLWVSSLCVLTIASANALAASGPQDFKGRWEVTTSYPGGTYVAGLDLVADSDRYTGRSAYLVPDFMFPFRYAGTLQKDGLHLQILAPDNTKVIGDLVLTVTKDTLSGRGTLQDVPIVLSGRRPLPRPATPTVRTFEPQVYYRSFSGANPPALRIFPGDTVRTKTVDAGGADEHGVTKSLPMNPQTGPFYIEGAMPGDTIAVHFNKIRLNRDTAGQDRDALLPGVLPPGYKQEPIKPWSSKWTLDRSENTATPDMPSDKLKNFKIKLIPMLGCVGVAPYWNQSFDSANLGPYGGNLDYNQIQEGTTLYLPVYQAGALLTIGDGHASQEDGEITGNGLETSMDVEFTVDLIPDEMLNQPWAENDAYIMVSGIGGSLPEALQQATAGLSNWLRSYYRLNSAEVATVLAAAIQYDVAEVTDPQMHIVAKIKKDVLNQLPKPERPKDMFCDGGCTLN
jgi:acetamidase/formamidase